MWTGRNTGNTRRKPAPVLISQREITHDMTCHDGKPAINGLSHVERLPLTNLSIQVLSTFLMNRLRPPPFTSFTTDHSPTILCSPRYWRYRWMAQHVAGKDIDRKKWEDRWRRREDQLGRWKELRNPKGNANLTQAYKPVRVATGTKLGLRNFSIPLFAMKTRVVMMNEAEMRADPSAIHQAIWNFASVKLMARERREQRGQRSLEVRGCHIQDTN
jgi:hypothetical protein